MYRKVRHLKCERLGHDYREYPSVIVCTPQFAGRHSFRSVAYDAEMVRVVCRRCWHEDEELRRIKVVSSIQSLGLPSDEMERFERVGYITRNSAW